MRRVGRSRRREGLWRECVYVGRLSCGLRHGGEGVLIGVEKDDEVAVL